MTSTIDPGATPTASTSSGTLSAKKAFGAFVVAKRQAAGLTQKELAERLFVTESAVSKWERGLSYPDITLVAPLSRELRISEAELINASDDLLSRRVEREARFYRRWKAAILGTTLGAYALALVVCFIVNLSVAHTLDWFWVVLCAIAVAFSLTTLPLLDLPRRGWLVPGAFLVSLFALLTVTRALYGTGYWLPIAITGVLGGAVVLLGPFALRDIELPSPASSHRTVIALGLDTLWLAILLFVIFVAREQMHDFGSEALPIAALAVLFVWVPALVIRYAPIPRLFAAAIVVGFLGVYEFLLFRPSVARIVDDGQRNPIDLSRWHDPYINGNVSLVVLLVALLAAAVLALLGAVRSRA